MRRNSLQKGAALQPEVVPQLPTPAWTPDVLQSVKAAEFASAPCPRLQVDFEGDDAAPICDVAGDAAASGSIQRQQQAAQTAAQELSDLSSALDMPLPPGRGEKRKAPTIQAIIDNLLPAPEKNDKAKEKKKRNVNGWTLHLTETWRVTPRHPGESKKERKIRVLRAARNTWAAACLLCSDSY